MTEWEDKATNAIRDAAAEWVVRLSGSNVTHADRSAFAAWLRRSPVHVKEYLCAETTWQAMDGAAQGDSSEIQALLRDGSGNVTEIHTRPEQGQPSGHGAAPVSGKPVSRYGAWRFVAVALAATLVLAIGLTFAPGWIERLDPNIYSTGVGEQRRVMLTDGSAIELNTRSQVRVRLNAESRDVHLLEGEAYFSVAKDPSRPFRVLSDTAVVRAIGTQFNVYRQAHKTIVTVIEGQVAVAKREEVKPVGDSTSIGSTPATGSPPVVVRAGSAVQVVPRDTIRLASVKPNAAVAWRHSRLVLENESLAAVVAEFNRYNTQQLVIESPQLAAKRISGTFDPHEAGDLVGFLTQNGDARAVETESKVVLSSPK